MIPITFRSAPPFMVLCLFVLAAVVVRGGMREPGPLFCVAIITNSFCDLCEMVSDRLKITKVLAPNAETILLPETSD